jgi:hypothetical protein
LAKYKNVGVGNNNEMDKMNCTNFNEKKKKRRENKKNESKMSSGRPMKLQ